MHAFFTEILYYVLISFYIHAKLYFSPWTETAALQQLKIFCHQIQDMTHDTRYFIFKISFMSFSPCLLPLKYVYMVVHLTK